MYKSILTVMTIFGTRQHFFCNSHLSSRHGLNCLLIEATGHLTVHHKSRIFPVLQGNIHRLLVHTLIQVESTRVEQCDLPSPLLNIYFEGLLHRLHVCTNAWIDLVQKTECSFIIATPRNKLAFPGVSYPGIH